MAGVRRIVVEVQEDLHQELRMLAIMNGFKLYVLVNEILRDFLGNEEQVKVLVKRLKR